MLKKNDINLKVEYLKLFLFLFVISFVLIGTNTSFAQTWVWPVPSALPQQDHVSGGWGDYYQVLNGYHYGLDITKGADAPIVAARDGTVVRSFYGDIENVYIGGGNVVVIYHADLGLYSHYCHMSSRAVSTGDTVKAGQTIGYMGQTGSGAHGIHLHFAIKTDSYGENEPVRCKNVNPIWRDANGITYLDSAQPQTGTLDVGGILDGTNNYSTGDYGTFDVYINNELKANDVTDYANTNLPNGTTYLIKDIKAKDGYSYDGTSQTFSGTITGGNTSIVWLPFNSCKLDVKGYLDKQIRDTLGYYGTFDVYINGEIKANDVNDFNQRITKGSSYEIKDIKAKTGYRYENVYSGSLTGTIGSGTKTVTLSFIRIGELSCDWIETSTLPGNVTTDNCEIQYNNHYQKSAASSPGSGWTKVSGSETTKYEPTGEADLAQPYPASNANNTTLVLVDRYYYHYCATDGTADYWTYGKYNREGIALRPGKNDLSYYSVTATHTDSNNSNVNYYELAWTAAGTAATGYSGTVWCGHSPASKYWYLNYIYEKRQPVTYYTWVKDSGWTTSRDSSASSVTFRYRLKSGCTRGITLPAGLKTINDSAFEGSTSIEEVTIPNSVTTIGARAFANCTNLTVVRIPNSVTSIGTNAFLNDSRLTLNCQSDNTTCSNYARNNNISLRIGY